MALTVTSILLHTLILNHTLTLTHMNTDTSACTLTFTYTDIQTHICPLMHTCTLTQRLMHIALRVAFFHLTVSKGKGPHIIQLCFLPWVSLNLLPTLEVTLLSSIPCRGQESVSNEGLNGKFLFLKVLGPTVGSLLASITDCDFRLST